MSRFLLRVLLFFIPLLILFGIFEGLIRNIPNDYARKYQFYKNNAADYHTWVLGSSHGYYDVYPEFFAKKTYNGAHISQTYEYDYKLYMKFSKRFKNLKVLIIPVSYFSFTSRLQNSVESWRVKNYSIYYKLFSNLKISSYFELLNGTLETNFDRVISFYRDSIGNITSSSLGNGLDYTFENRLDLQETGKVSAARHTAQNFDEYEFNLKMLRNIIEDCEKKNIKVLLFTPPAYETYKVSLNKEQLDISINAAIELQSEYSFVKYLNFFNDASFVTEDYYDADHLNERGAEKLSVKLDSIVNALQ